MKFREKVGVAVFSPEYVASPDKPDAVRRLRYVGRTVLCLRVLTMLTLSAGIIWLVIIPFANYPDPDASVMTIMSSEVTLVWLCVTFAVAFGMSWLMKAVVWLLRLSLRRFLKSGDILQLDPKVIKVYNVDREHPFRYDPAVLYSFQRQVNMAVSNLLLPQNMQ